MKKGKNDNVSLILAAQNLLCDWKAHIHKQKVLAYKVPKKAAVNCENFDLIVQFRPGFIKSLKTHRVAEIFPLVFRLRDSTSCVFWLIVCTVSCARAELNEMKMPRQLRQAVIWYELSVSSSKIRFGVVAKSRNAEADSKWLDGIALGSCLEWYNAESCIFKK